MDKKKDILERKDLRRNPYSVPEGYFARLQDRLCRLTGKQVDLQNRVDPTVLGGIRLQYEEHELDGTVRQRLRAVEKTLSETVI